MCWPARARTFARAAGRATRKLMGPLAAGASAQAATEAPFPSLLLPSPPPPRLLYRPCAPLLGLARPNSSQRAARDSRDGPKKARAHASASQVLDQFARIGVQAARRTVGRRHGRAGNKPKRDWIHWRKLLGQLRQSFPACRDPCLAVPISSALDFQLPKQK